MKTTKIIDNALFNSSSSTKIVLYVFKKSMGGYILCFRPDRIHLYNLEEHLNNSAIIIGKPIGLRILWSLNWNILKRIKNLPYKF